LKTLLVRPPIFSSSLDYPQGPRFGVPVGLLYLAASLEAAGHEVAIYDALIDVDFDGLVSDADGRFHIGASREAFMERVRSEKPDVVGVTNPFADFAGMALWATRAAREALPACKTVVGGPHATAVPEFFLSDDSVDFVVRGEGEFSFLTLLDYLKQGKAPVPLDGVAGRQTDGKLCIGNPSPLISDLDALPLPAYHLIDMERYFAIVRRGFPSRFAFEYPGSDREVSIITSRGCPFRCVFCGNHLHMGRRFRAHSAEQVLRHMALLVESHGVRHFHFEDDNLSLDVPRFDAILSGILARGWKITWDTPNGIRADALPPALLEKISRTGCTYLTVGIESGNQDVVKNIVKKALSLNAVEETVRTCRKLKIDVHGFYIVGFPGETLVQVDDTFAFAERLYAQYDVVPHFGMARPLPGTELYRICEEKGYLTDPIIPEIGRSLKGEVFERRMIATPEFSPSDLEKRMDSFNRRMIRTILRKTIFFLMRHPTVWFRLARMMLHYRRERPKIIAKRLFFAGLLYKFNYLHRF
jgi:anaerobic magnesium-protoporphyrin IX monomethyl ester cyclase